MLRYVIRHGEAGHDFIGVVVCAVVHDGIGNMLLLKRGANARDEHGKWDICGGGIDFGESIETALIRELDEELKLFRLKLDF